MGSRTWRGQRERIAWGLGRVHLLGGTIQQQLLLPRGCAGKALQSGSVPVSVDRAWQGPARHVLATDTDAQVKPSPPALGS